MTPVTCRELTAALLDFVAGEAPADVCDAIRSHLDCCPPCVVLVETYKITIEVTHHLPPQPMPERLCERLRQCLCELKQQRQ